MRTEWTMLLFYQTGRRLYNALFTDYRSRSVRFLHIVETMQTKGVAYYRDRITGIPFCNFNCLAIINHGREHLWTCVNRMFRTVRRSTALNLNEV